jgi:hypothetical protein
LKTFCEIALPLTVSSIASLLSIFFMVAFISSSQVVETKGVLEGFVMVTVGGGTTTLGGKQLITILSVAVP